MRVILAFALLAALVAAGDVSFTGDGYKMDLVGSSGKLKLSKESDPNGRFLMLTMDTLEEVDTNGNTVNNGVPSWASQNFNWQSTGCKTTSYNAAVTACFQATVNVGSNSGSTTAQLYVDAKLINQSYYSPMVGSPERPCNQGICQADGECARRKKSCASTSDSACASECDAGWTADINGVCFQCRDGTTNTGVVTADKTCPAVVCKDGSTYSAKTDGVACPVSQVTVKKYDAVWDCTLVPAHSLKFGLEVTNWPWKGGSTTNELRFGASLSGPGGAAKKAKEEKTDGKPKKVSFDGNFYFEVNDNVEICSGATTCVTEEAKYTYPTASSIQWTFPHFTHHMVYDPIIGEGASSPAASVSSHPIAMLVLLFVLAMLTW